MNVLKRTLFLTKDGTFVYGQKPNIPILVWLVATVLARISLLESMHNTLQTIATISLLIWALLEVFLGVNLFRRILGGIVLFFIIFNRL